MSTLTYLSIPYSSPNPEVRDRRVAAAEVAMTNLIRTGRLVVCPVIMNHAAIKRADGRLSETPGDYWRELEIRLAAACDELVVLMEQGWQDSRGVAREIALFEAAGKLVTFMPKSGSTPALPPRSQANSVVASAPP